MHFLLLGCTLRPLPRAPVTHPLPQARHFSIPCNTSPACNSLSLAHLKLRVNLLHPPEVVLLAIKAREVQGPGQGAYGGGPRAEVTIGGVVE